MKKIYSLTLVPFLLVSIFRIACDQIFDPQEDPEFHLQYNITGGFAGLHNSLSILENDSVYYNSRTHQIKTTFGQQKIREIYTVLTDHNYFNLKSEYLPDQAVMDDFLFTITFQAKTVRAAGICSHNCGDSQWPGNLKSIISYLDELIADLTQDIDTGKAEIRSSSELEEWPFSDKIELAEHLHQNVAADKDIFDHFKQRHQQNKEVSYFKGEWIYYMHSSGGYALDYSELDTFYLSIHSRNQGIQWPFEPALADLGASGLVLSGTDYFWLKDTLARAPYPAYFLDDELQTGGYVYLLNLRHGNNL